MFAGCAFASERQNLPHELSKCSEGLNACRLKNSPVRLVDVIEVPFRATGLNVIFDVSIIPPSGISASLGRQWVVVYHPLPHAKVSSSALCPGRFIERSAQPTGELECIVICPEVHEEEPRLLG